MYFKRAGKEKRRKEKIFLNKNPQIEAQEDKAPLVCLLDGPLDVFY